MEQSKLKPPAGAKHGKKRVGRGNGSGHGNYSGRGCKGQKSRSGGKVHLGFEGGQLPLIKRLPRKRGFVNIFRLEYNIVNVGQLNVFPPDTIVTSQELFKTRLIKLPERPLKILGTGEINCPLTVQANKFSAAAEKKIVAAGGKIKGR